MDVAVERPLVEPQGDALDLFAVAVVVGYGEVGHKILSKAAKIPTNKWDVAADAFDDF